MKKRVHELLSLVPRREYQAFYDLYCDHGHFSVEAQRQNLAGVYYLVDSSYSVFQRNRKVFDSLPFVPTHTRTEEIRPEKNSLLIFAGVGGEQMVKDMKALRDYCVNCEFVLSPESKTPYVRKRVHQLGFKLISQKAIYWRDQHREVLLYRKDAVSFCLPWWGGWEYWGREEQLREELLAQYRIARVPDSDTSEIYHKLVEGPFN